ncbi:slipin family protein [Fulvivirga sp.]|uniref:slipin family protein n=1 Tax=Fulvivirga sp. TaxID=1931237 RepID=UPI0032EDD4A2
MKRVRINEGYVGLVFRNGNYKRVITAGVYWLGIYDAVYIYNMAKPFQPGVELELLLKDETLKSMLEIVEVKDTEIAIQYDSGNFLSVLKPGKHVFWKGLKDYSFVKADLTKVDITEKVNVDIIKLAEFVPYVRVCKVESFERGILFIDNKMDRVLDAGEYYFWKNAKTVSVIKVDLRQLQIEVSGQEILTKDKAALRINFSTQYKVVDVLKAVIDNKDYERQLYVLIQLALREYIGGFTLDELLVKRDEISTYVFDTLKVQAAELGVVINSCGVKDIILPGEVKDILNQVLIAQKKAEANVITRREETASTRSLLNTAKLMEENEMLYKLKEMEYVEKIADKIGEITLAGNGQILDQLKGIFTPTK